MAARNEDAPEPVGRGRGLAPVPPPPVPPPPVPPPPNPPDGGVTPWASRHFWKVELCDVPEVEVEVELVELPPQAATDTTVASTTAPSAAGLAALRPSVTLNRRTKRFLLTAPGRRVPRPPGRALVSRHMPVKEARLAISLWLPHGFVSRP
jgi:hypothetical protein